MENDNVTGDYSHIKGWGVDADSKNDPTYPMKQRTEEAKRGYNWERPPQQPINIEVLHSNERPNVSAVFGTSAPPRGLSGKIRRYAFQYGEGSYAHWLPLMLADRVDEVEGLIEDLKKGKVPMILSEKGIKAEWKHNRKTAVRRIAVTAAVTTAVLTYLYRKTTSRK